MLTSSLKEKSVYLSPKNNITEYLEIKLEQENIFIKGYIDTYKDGENIFKNDVVQKSDFILIYSPNFWKDISNNLKTESIYIVDNEFNLVLKSDFNEYRGSINFDVNTLPIQKLYWHKHLKLHAEENNNFDKYGFEWGNPENENDELGNYLSINERLQSKINKNSTVIEIGTLGGKWTKYMLDAKKIICVDINNFFIKAIEKRFSTYLDKFQFYISSGDELNEIESNSVDVVFCIDTLVRVEKVYIFNYLKEISRVLSSNSEAIIHLPNSDIEDCRNRNFTNLNTSEIRREAKKHFSSFELDSNSIVHGTMLYAKK